jgi:hypothetical protein
MEHLIELLVASDNDNDNKEEEEEEDDDEKNKVRNLIVKIVSAV